MTDDKQAIKQMIADWAEATEAGDVSKLLEMMTDDVVFLQVGQEPMRGKDAFKAHFRKAADSFRIEAHIDVLEVDVRGDLAYSWNHLTVTATPTSGGSPAKMAGYTLTIFKKLPKGNWVIARDANLLSSPAPRFA